MKLVSWNIEGRLSRFSEADDRGSPEQIIKEIDGLNGDIVVLPEAFDGTKPIEPAVQSLLNALGYRCIAVSYDEHDDRQYQANIEPQIMLLSRLDIVQFQECRFGDIRTTVMADVTDPVSKEVVRIFGIHLDDRNEANRIKQVEDLVDRIVESPHPVVAMGDFNAMYRSSVQAKILRNRLVKLGIDHFPRPSMKDILQRLSEMAIGDTMSYLESFTDLQPGDPSRRPTITPKMRGMDWMPSIPLVQIDHILASPEIEVNNFQVSHDGGSDHRAILAEVDITGQKS